MRTHKTISVEGSHGTLIVHAATGAILERTTTCGCEDCVPEASYASILFFDPLGWDAIALNHGATDILFTSFWDCAGYARAMSTASVWGPRDSAPWVYADEVYLLEDLRHG
jgi:hypothetical protein